jgi:hypothetical protein
MKCQTIEPLLSPVKCCIYIAYTVPKKVGLSPRSFFSHFQINIFKHRSYHYSSIANKNINFFHPEQAPLKCYYRLPHSLNLPLHPVMIIFFCSELFLSLLSSVSPYFYQRLHLVAIIFKFSLWGVSPDPRRSSSYHPLLYLSCEIRI